MIENYFLKTYRNFLIWVLYFYAHCIFSLFVIKKIKTEVSMLFNSSLFSDHSLSTVSFPPELVENKMF